MEEGEGRGSERNEREKVNVMKEEGERRKKREGRGSKVCAK
jgi:hypothetical protein